MKFKRTAVALVTAAALFSGATACSSPSHTTHSTVVHHVHHSPAPVKTVVHVHHVHTTPSPVKTKGSVLTKLKKVLKKKH